MGKIRWREEIEGRRGEKQEKRGKQSEQESAIGEEMRVKVRMEMIRVRKGRSNEDGGTLGVDDDVIMY